ncbi:MAG: DUF4384 domain-containing protein [Alphaproteobacteria bacterium]|nr:DUF4384 domain-containing protein [Alphaproteobacteria bacterium]
MRNLATRTPAPRDVPAQEPPPAAVVPDDGDIMPPDPVVPLKQAAPTLPPPVPPRRSPVMAIAVAVISFLVVVGAGAAYMLLGKSNPSPTVTASAPAEVPIPPSSPPPAVTPPPAAVATASPPPEPAVPPPPVPPPAPVASTSPPPAAPAPASPTPAPPAPAAAAAPTQTAALPIAPKLRDETNASLQHLFAGFQCADLTADVSDDLRVDVAGFVGQQADLDKLHNALHGMEHVKLGTDTVAVYTFPHCAFVKLLRETASAAPAAAAPRLDFNKPSRVYKNGDKLTVKATEGKQRDGYLYVDYIDNGGTVVHIFPTPLRKNNFVKAGQQVSIGTTDPNAKGDERVYEISEPFGPNLIIAISSPKPLFETHPDEAEPADQYLRSLQARLTAMAATPAGKEMSSTYNLIDTVP